jgi:hypothetical protein
LIEGQRQKAGANRRRRRKPKNETKAKVDPILIVARRPDSPLMLKVSNRNIAASGRPKKRAGVFHAVDGNGASTANMGSTTQDVSAQDMSAQDVAAQASGAVEATAAVQHATVQRANAVPQANMRTRRAEFPRIAPSAAAPQSANANADPSNGVANGFTASVLSERPRRVARAAQNDGYLDDLDMKRQRLIERLVSSEGRGAISKLADELAHHNWPIPEEQAVQIQLLEHVDERRASEALDVMTRLLSTESPIKRPILDQRLRRLEEGAEDAETRQKAAALRRTLRVA